MSLYYGGVHCSMAIRRSLTSLTEVDYRSSINELIRTQTRARQEPFDFMSVRVAAERCMLVPYNFAVNENMVEA